MKNKPVIFYLYFISLIILAFVCICINIGIERLKESSIKREIKILENKAFALSASVSKQLDNSTAALKDFLDSYPLSAYTRIMIIMSDGTPAADSYKKTENIENYLLMPEIIKARQGTFNSGTVFDPYIKRSEIYSALPIKKDGSIQAIIRISTPLDNIDKDFEKLKTRLIFSILAAALIGFIFFFYIFEKTKDSLDKIESSLKHFSASGPSYNLKIPETKIFAGLTEAISRLSQTLTAHIKESDKQAEEYRLVLSSLHEGIIILDMEGRISNCNFASIELLKKNISFQIKGKKIQELIRNIQLDELIKKAFNDKDIHEIQISDYDSKTAENRILLIKTYPLLEKEKYSSGRLLILSDITKIKKLEALRNDFVSNVSHELKTPLTAIKGFTETLYNGAIENREEAEKFLKIIEKHTNRLIDIIDDLLILSQIEDNQRQTSIKFEPCILEDIIDLSIGICRPSLSDKNIEIFFNPKNKHKVDINPRLFERAIVNIIDNAIKFSKTDSKIYIETDKKRGKTYVSIKDEGPGISKKDIENIFERFYQKNKDGQGTGLGLSIVKNIAEIHKGVVYVKSGPGTGSVFTIEI